jgi:type I restriction enzyme, S subunit
MSWPAVPLQEVAEIERSSVKPEDIASGTSYLGLEHIQSGGIILGCEEVEKGDLASNKFTFGPRHILYGKLRPYLAKIALPDFEGICSTDILPVLPTSRIDRVYLAHYLRQPSMVDYASSRSTGVNLPRLSPKSLAEFPIPLPPLEEQRRIAGILDQADELRRLRTRALDKLNALGQAIFHEMFGHRDGDIEPWEKTSLSELVLPEDRINYGVVQPGPHDPNGVPIIRVADLANPLVDFDVIKRIAPNIDAEYGRSRLKGGEVLVGCVGSIGTTVIAPPEFAGANVARAVARVPLDTSRCEPKFVAEQLRSQRVQNYFTKEVRLVAQPTLNIKQIRETEIILPPKELQVAFVERVREIERNKALHVAALAASEAMFASLQWSAFQGEI